MRVAVTGAAGRLGRALVEAIDGASFAPTGVIAWRRPEFDLDEPDAYAALLERHRPEVVVHAAAWTDVDGCARDPDLAMARNGTATTRLARACAQRGVDLVLVSTNEVFDGRRTDGRGYAADDSPSPINAYGDSKRAGEEGGTEAYESATGRPIEPFVPVDAPPAVSPQLAIVRTAWLYGPPGNDFPAKILAAAERAASASEPLRIVGDEVGSPTYTIDLAEAIVDLLGAGAFAGIHHVVNGGAASRADWARELFAQTDVDVEIEEVPASTWRRASTPPLWSVLEPTPLPSGEPLRPWPAALADYVPELLRARAALQVR
jgi:dTDP-4-dehydrorhamnose reductase